MSIRVALRHRIEQRFSRPVVLSTHWLRLRPAPLASRRVTAYSLSIDAQPHFVNWVRDPFENYLARLDLPEPVPGLGLDLELIAELEPVNPFDFLVEPHASNYPFAYEAQMRRELTPYLALPPLSARFSAWVEALDAEPGYIVVFLTLLNQKIQGFLAGTDDSRRGAVDPEAVIARGSGSPWELAWLATLALRKLGLAARFVSGYQLRLAQPPGAVFHAWTEVYLPGAGWIGLDPAAGVFTDESYLPLAAAPDPLRALPVVGYREACEERVNERVEARLLEGAPPCWPFTPAEWGDVQAIGHKIDADLNGGGVAMTVQSSLTFVSTVAADLDEWNGAAMGTDKRRVAEDLLLRLRDRIAPGAALQVIQGELFAGEALPRWALGCWSRADGAPVCRDPQRIAWGEPGDAASLVDAERFGRHLARALGVAPEWLAAAYEDGLYRRWRETAGLDGEPDAAQLHDPERRRALAQRLSQRDGELRGYVLPLRWDAAAAAWTSGAWRMRRGAIYLLPGDSAMGYRLPIEGLPLATQRQLDAERCQFEERPLLREVHGEVSARLSHVAGGSAPPAEADAETTEPVPRTAVCIEIRAGRLHCFVPPLSHLEHYLELVAAIEAAAAALHLGIVLEGYGPPQDHRLRRIVLEPDAGILRLHLPAAADTAELEAMLRQAFAEAAACGLGAERVMPDGSRWPPGAGAPLVLGGVQPAQSPFLRRPEILRSLIAFWHRHPSLSYLFAGRAIGPSGGTPRVDEGRDEALYELAIALERLPAGDAVELWLTDRVLRHLLTDPAGDMARAEIRVDELYDPVRAGRRLGRVTLGSFEMAPAAELAMLQALLVRGLIARFARFPERAPLQPWGTQLQDRFLLPRLLWEDFRTVLDTLGEAGYPFQADWFEVLLARRFPRLGRVEFGDIAAELHQAHEPWTVLAEEVTAGGVARFVDAALDRVQVTLSGLAPGRYVLECNGECVPLRGTGAVGEYVAGVRYKASNPPATLHPTAPPVDVLVFDLLDTWSGRIVGGFSYHPAPADQAAVRAAPAQTAIGLGPLAGVVSTAEGMPLWRRGGRFEPRGSGRQFARPGPQRVDPERPYLLDLSFPQADG